MLNWLQILIIKTLTFFTENAKCVSTVHKYQVHLFNFKVIIKIIIYYCNYPQIFFKLL